MPARSLLLGLLVLTNARADEAVDYRRDIKPLLAARCVSCHGALQQKAGLRLDAGQLILKGSKNGPILRPGKSDASLLLDALLGKDRSRMPPEKDGAPLTEKQIALFRRWIDQGAKAPTEPVPEDPRRHWAFVKPVRPPLPNLKSLAEVRNPIDRFVNARLEAAGPGPRPEADRATLLRRVSLDLVGLPPTPRELRDFLADTSSDAYEKVVERLLQSPHHGERWARHWMDVWRYSDWYGRRGVPDVWNSAPQIWRWRDWIVRSLNQDHGYDRLLQEMLAGDEINPQDDGARDATGYLVRNWYALNPNQWMRDIVEHTGKAFLGLTLQCAHCHDHKYDPITQEEYFRFRAFFEPLGLRQDRVPGEADPGPFQKYDYSVLRKVVKTGAVRVFDENPGAKTLLYNLGDERDLMKGKPPASPGAPAFVGGDKLDIVPVALPLAVWNPGLREDFHREDLARLKAALAEAEKTATPPTRIEKARLERARAQLDSYHARLAAERARHDGARGDYNSLARVAAKAERVASLRAVEERLALAEQAESAAPAAGKTKAQQEVTAARKAVEAATKALSVEDVKFTPLSPVYPASSTGRRRALALWITSRDNPLTARVAVNHVWKHYLGGPIVETVADLGRNGARPSHPELLDWLAVELMESGWSLKHLHRLIVTSAAYRRQSTPGEGPEAGKDPDNRLLWRFPTRRLEAEVIRDAVLFCAGELDHTIGGASLDNVKDADLKRRSLYFSVYPEDGGQHRFLELFDPPDPCDCYRRSASVVPQQALVMTSSRLLVDHSRLLARRLSAEASDEGFITSAFERLLSRRPTEKEATLCREFLRRQEELFRTEKSAATSPVGGVAPSPDPRQRARESLIRVLFSHDDFVTVR